MPWEKQYDEDELLERATEAFWERGYAATSINDLVARTGVNRGSLYAAFTDKRTLFIRALAHYDKQHRRDVLAELRRLFPPNDAIREAFRRVIPAGRDRVDCRGCLIVNTALELSPHDSEIEEIVNKSLKEVEDFFRKMIVAAQEDGTIPAQICARETAQMLLSLFLGLRVISRSSRDEELMQSVLGQVENLLS